MPRLIGYCAAKAGVNALMEGLRLELRGQNIDCTTICPGWIQSDMTAHIRHAPQMMSIEDAVQAIVWAIRRKKAFHAFPRSKVWPLRLLRLLPGRLNDWLTARAFQREFRKIEIKQNAGQRNHSMPHLDSEGVNAP